VVAQAASAQRSAAMNALLWLRYPALGELVGSGGARTPGGLAPEEGLERTRIIAHHGRQEGTVMADSRTTWQRELAGESDHGVTTARVMVLAIAAVIIALVWLGPKVGASEPTTTTRPPSPCAQLHRLERAGVHHGPDFWAAKGGCPSGR